MVFMSMIKKNPPSNIASIVVPIPIVFKVAGKAASVGARINTCQKPDPNDKCQ